MDPFQSFMKVSFESKKKIKAKKYYVLIDDEVPDIKTLETEVVAETSFSTSGRQIRKSSTYFNTATESISPANEKRQTVVTISNKKSDKNDKVVQIKPLQPIVEISNKKKKEKEVIPLPVVETVNKRRKFDEPVPIDPIKNVEKNISTKQDKKRKIPEPPEVIITKEDKKRRLPEPPIVTINKEDKKRRLPEPPIVINNKEEKNKKLPEPPIVIVNKEEKKQKLPEPPLVIVEEEPNRRRRTNQNINYNENKPYINSKVTATIPVIPVNPVVSKEDANSKKKKPVNPVVSAPIVSSPKIPSNDNTKNKSKTNRYSELQDSYVPLIEKIDRDDRKVFNKQNLFELERRMLEILAFIEEFTESNLNTNYFENPIKSNSDTKESFRLQSSALNEIFCNYQPSETDENEMNKKSKDKKGKKNKKIIEVEEEDDEDRLIAFEFREVPYDIIPEYDDLVENPMSIDIMKENIQNHTYLSMSSLIKDFYCLLNNARSITEKDSQIRLDSEILAELFEKCKIFSKTNSLLHTIVLNKDYGIIIKPCDKVDKNSIGIHETCILCSHLVFNKFYLI